MRRLVFLTKIFYFVELFDNYMQQDAHEFLNYLLNTIADILQEEKRQEKQTGAGDKGTSIGSSLGQKTNKLALVGVSSANSVTPTTVSTTVESTSLTNNYNYQSQQSSSNKPQEITWVHDIFQGTLTNETRCLNCETVNITIFKLSRHTFSIFSPF